MEKITTETKFDKVFYMKALVGLANADGKISPAEFEFITVKANLLDIDISDYWKQEFNIDSFDFSLYSKFTKKLLVRDFILLSYSDGDFDESESHFINSIADKFMITQNEIADLTSWVIDYNSVMKRGVEIIEN